MTAEADLSLWCFMGPNIMKLVLFLVQIPLALVSASLSASQFLVCRISCEPVVGFLPNFSWIYNWDITKNWLDFGYLDLIFKVTAIEKLKILGVGRPLFSLKTLLLYDKYYFCSNTDLLELIKIPLMRQFQWVPTKYIFLVPPYVWVYAIHIRNMIIIIPDKAIVSAKMLFSVKMYVVLHNGSPSEMHFLNDYTTTYIFVEK